MHIHIYTCVCVCVHIYQALCSLLSVGREDIDAHISPKRSVSSCSPELMEYLLKIGVRGQDTVWGYLLNQ